MNYREAIGERRCGNCVMYHRDNSVQDKGRCDLVDGIIDADNTCDRWEAA